MTRFRPLPAIAVLLAMLLPAPALLAQGRSTSAREALDTLSTQFGPRSVQWIAEMSARGGVPQPAEWEVLAFDERMPLLLSRFRSGMGRAGNMGPDQQRYTMSPPVGYFSPNQLGVDSVAAFTIAEGEARKARVAFDSCDYQLRVREFSTEPLWRLELLDANRRIVGKIYLSGNSGAVLRTVWVYRDQGSYPRIVDSFAPVGNRTDTGLTDNEYPVLGPEPGGETGIVQMVPPGIPVPPVPPGIPVPPTPGDTGIASIPPPPTPRTPRMFPPGNDPGAITTPQTAPSGGIPPRTSPAPAPAPSGRSGSGSAVDNSIPEPPSISGSSGTSREMQDLRGGSSQGSEPQPTRPPIEVPSGSGSSERIPPPPVPPGS